MVACDEAYAGVVESPTVVFNRSDCPYGCGAALDANLRWQATPCRECGRPLYPLHEALDNEGRRLWPPETVPRPAEAARPGSDVWYVVGEHDAAARKAATQGLRDDLHDRACREQLLILVALLIAVVAVIGIALYVVVSPL